MLDDVRDEIQLNKKDSFKDITPEEIEELKNQYNDKAKDSMQQARDFMDELSKLLDQDELKGFLEADPSSMDEDMKNQQKELKEAQKMLSEKMSDLADQVDEIENLKNQVSDDLEDTAQEKAEQVAHEGATDAQQEGLNN